MPRRYYPPAFLRYLKARLWNLARPGFWVPAIFLSVVGLGIKEYWTHPDFLTQEQKKPVVSHQPVNSSLSQEDKAIAADIDNLPVLYNEDQTALPPTPSTDSDNIQQSKTKPLLDDLNSKSLVSASEVKPNPSVDTANSSPALKLENPFLTQAQNLLQGGTSQTDRQLLGVNSSTSSSVQPGVAPISSPVGLGVAPTYPNSSMGSATQIYSSQSVAPVSLSQPAFNQSTNQNLPSVSSTTTIGQNSLVGQSLPTNYSPSQILPQNTGLSRNLINPTSTGTGYTQPAQINQPQNSYSTINPYVTGYNQLPNPYSSLNTYSRYGQVRYGINQFLNGSTNPTSGQVLPSAVPSTQVVSPATSAASGYTTPYYTQTPSQGVVTPSNPVVSNYSTYGWQQPTQVPQYNIPSSSQVPGQYTTGAGQVNYSYP
ncbi:MAG: hypothetical protein DSM106950_36990 [Stigonema ocellatum SAG 48.90 = DSM 106950]|nr:hypothetical protein [Stigonema ocellatum SAG 48.90 = DSM 106950]